MKRNRTLCFSSYKNRKLTVKLWWVGACERKKSTHFVSFVLSEENFLNICFVSMYSVLITLPEYTYFYIWKKHYFINFCCLLLKPSKAFSVSLMNHNSQNSPTQIDLASYTTLMDNCPRQNFKIALKVL